MYASVYENKWNIKDRRATVEKMVSKGYSMIDNHFDFIQSILAQKYKDRYMRYASEFHEENSKVRKEQVKNVDILILNESINTP